jgi:hypothetical protein
MSSQLLGCDRTLADRGENHDFLILVGWLPNLTGRHSFVLPQTRKVTYLDERRPRAAQ